MVPEQIVSQLEHQFLEYSSTLHEYLSKRSNKIVYQAKLYIEEHYQNGLLSLNDVAEDIGVNASYLSTLFSNVTGMRFTEYLSKRRIDAAKYQLKHTSIPVKDIYLECGFNSVQNFNRVFKQHTGLSPGEYRQTHS